MEPAWWFRDGATRQRLSGDDPLLHQAIGTARNIARRHDEPLLIRGADGSLIEMQVSPEAIGFRMSRPSGGCSLRATSL